VPFEINDRKIPEIGDAQRYGTAGIGTPVSEAVSSGGVADEFSIPE
jgi:hypothetical protein